jgi:hypothetical protein
MTKRLKIPPGSRDVTSEHLNEIIVMTPARMVGGKLDPGSIEVIDDAETVEVLRDWLKAETKEPTKK